MRDNDFRGSDRTLFDSKYASTSSSINSSRSNIQTSPSCSYNNSRNDVHSVGDLDDDDDDEDDDGVGEDDEEDDISSRDQGKQEETENDRGLWEQKLHYIWLGFGVAFSIRNVISFPALVTRHGGGAFLFTYVILTFTLGIPLIYLEVSLGQYARGGVVKAWGLMPLAKGICVSSMLFTLVSASYSTTPSTWALYYLYLAMAGRNPYPDAIRSENVTCVKNVSSIGSTPRPAVNLSAFHPSFDATRQFFHQTVLQASSSIVHFDSIIPHLVVCLIIIWVIILLYSSLGPRLMGKFSFIFTVIPSVLLLITAIGICTLPGSVAGIRAFLNPHWKHLSKVEVWLDSLEFVLSSLASGTGVFISLSGHCHFHSNTFRNAMLMTTLSVSMTTMCGCMMLAAMGVQSKLMGKEIDALGHNGESDFGFVVLPTVSTNLPTPGFWNGIFYISLVLLSVGRTAMFITTLHRGIFDFVRVEEPGRRLKYGVLGGLALILTTLSCITVTRNGFHIQGLLQISIPRIVPPMICVSQCVTIGWGYGARRFAGRVSEMTGKNKSFVWKWLWRWGCPFALSISVLVSLLTTNVVDILPAADFNRKWLHAIGWIISAAILLPGITMAAVSFFKVRGTFKQRLKQLRSTPACWGPGHPEHEPQADLPDYVICHPDPFRPANALAMLTANLYLPNIVNFVNMKNGNKADMSPGYLSDLATLSSSDDEGSIDVPTKKGFFTRCHATISCLGHVFGLGNLVRFPYLAYRHGGGAFLIAYLILLLTCGLPLMVIETAIGQFSSLGPIAVWRAVPFFKGIGFSMVGISFMTSAYYGVMTSYAVYYSATALTSAMPWQYCDNSWNTNSCSIIVHSPNLCKNLSTTTAVINQTTCNDVTNCFRPPATTATPCHTSSNMAGNLSSSIEEYLYLSVANVSSGFHETGQLRWQLVLCLFLMWTAVLLSLVKGSKPKGKTVYLILTFILTLLIILLIRCSSLPGGQHGLRHLFTLEWSRLTSGHVWRDAASQLFFSLSLGSGSIIGQSTYNKFNSHVFREASLVCLADTCISLLASLVIFAVVGAISHSTGISINETLRADIGMPFIVYSHAAINMPWPVFWAVCIFVLLVIGGLTTCSSSTGTVIVALTDIFRSSLKKQRMWLLLSVGLGAFLLGMPLTVQAGYYVIDLFDLHLSGLPQLAVCGSTLVAFSWIYGGSQLSSDIARMINAPVGLWWRVVCGVISPCFFAGVFVVSVTSLVYNGDHPHHPTWATVLGLVLWLMLISPIIMGMGHEICFSRSGAWLQRIRRSCQPRKGWGASSRRGQSHVEYFPTVHTHLGIELDQDCVNTITDRVEFTTVGVRVPSLSQTTLLPVSPKTTRNKRPMDMRHKAILNHAYSNPQCNSSSGSLEKAGKKKRRPRPSSITLSNDNVPLNRKSSPSVCKSDAGTQTDPGWWQNKLKRQQSQPQVAVTAPVRLITRSSSWHCINGEPAVLMVKTRTHLHQIIDAKGDNATADDNDDDDGGYHSIKKCHKDEKNQRADQNNQTGTNNPSSDKSELISADNKSRYRKKKEEKPQQPSNQVVGGNAIQHPVPMPMPVPITQRKGKNSVKRRRRMGQSKAPNLSMLLMSMEEATESDKSYQRRGSAILDAPSQRRGSVIGTGSFRRPSTMIDTGSFRRGSTMFDAISQRRGSLMVEAGSKRRGSVMVDAVSKRRGSALLDTASQRRGSAVFDTGTQRHVYAILDSSSAAPPNRRAFSLDKEPSFDSANGDYPFIHTRDSYLGKRRKSVDSSVKPSSAASKRRYSKQEEFPIKISGISMDATLDELQTDNDIKPNNNATSTGNCCASQQNQTTVGNVCLEPNVETDTSSIPVLQISDGTSLTSMATPDQQRRRLPNSNSFSTSGSTACQCPVLPVDFVSHDDKGQRIQGSSCQHRCYGNEDDSASCLTCSGHHSSSVDANSNRVVGSWDQKGRRLSRDMDKSVSNGGIIMEEEEDDIDLQGMLAHELQACSDGTTGISKLKRESES